MAYKKYKKYYKDAKSDYKKLKMLAKKKKKTATTKEVGDRSALNTLIDRVPVFQRASQLVKNMMYYEGIKSMNTLADKPQLHFKANGIYDPDDGVGSGHQPIGHDQMMTFYEHFCVIRSNISVTFINPSTENYFRVGVVLTPDTAAVESRQLIENGYCKTAALTPKGSAGCTRTINLSCDVKNYFGRGSYKDMLNDERLVGDLNNDPFERVHFGLFAIPAFDLGEVNVVADVCVAYDVIYFEPKKIALS